MIELTEAECLELEKKVSEKFSNSDDSGSGKLGAVIARVASRATILTIREYEKMKAPPQVDQQSDS